MNGEVYRLNSAVGVVTIEPLDSQRHFATIHRWVNHERAAFWGLRNSTPADVEAEYLPMIDSEHHRAWFGKVAGWPAFLAETYDPARSPLAGLPDLAPGDTGMHVLIAPSSHRIAGYTTAVFDAVMKFCFDNPRTQRVVVEPDVRNLAIRRKNVAAGFVELREIELPDKTAILSVCSKESFQPQPPHSQPERADPVAHLTPETLDRAQRRLVAKALGELSHERLLKPEDLGDDRYQITSPRARYTFTARRSEPEHWRVDPASVECFIGDQPAPIDVQRLIAELAGDLGVTDELLPFYLEELAATVAGAAWKDIHCRIRVDDLLNADLATTEAAMTEGHPAFIANNGRIGYSVNDHVAYAPESGSAVQLHWVAARRSKAHLSLGAGLTEKALYELELDQELAARFEAHLADRDLDPADFLFIPLHPWQWEHKIAIAFAIDLARQDLVYLGTGVDRYAPQQSVRTFLNLDRPDRHYVKTALSVQNMGFLRGLSPGYMRVTPAINDWLSGLVAADDELQARGFSVIRERAAIGYTGDAYHLTEAPSGHKKMLAALWRETPFAQLGDGERAATMASLLHQDADGNSLAAAMIEASGLAPAEWLRRYADAYLVPIIHCLVAHELAFMPHGENLIIVFRDHAPVRAIMKDIGEEIAVFNDQPLPPEIERIRMSMPDEDKVLAVLTDALDGFLRFLAAILSERNVLTDSDFWSVMAIAVLAHRARHPELAAAAERIDVLTPEFSHSCLNRLQLRNTKQMVNIADQSTSLIFAGTLVNPMATAAVTLAQ